MAAAHMGCGRHGLEPRRTHIEVLEWSTGNVPRPVNVPAVIAPGRGGAVRATLISLPDMELRALR